jgi:hypothetical protein
MEVLLVEQGVATKWALFQYLERIEPAKYPIDQVEELVMARAGLLLLGLKWGVGLMTTMTTMTTIWVWLSMRHRHHKRHQICGRCPGRESRKGLE